MTLSKGIVRSPTYNLIPDIPQADVDAHIWTGDYDFLINHIGTEFVIQNMTWSSK